MLSSRNSAAVEPTSFKIYAEFVLVIVTYQLLNEILEAVEKANAQELLNHAYVSETYIFLMQRLSVILSQS